MPAPYDMDLRTRAIQAVGEGMRKKDVCQSLRIGREALRRWIILHRETGNIEPARLGRPSSPVPEGFSETVETEPDITQDRLGLMFGVCQRTACNWLRKAGFTRKKNFWVRKRDEATWENFRKRISGLDPNKIVYVDESGFDNAARVEYGYALKGKRCHAMKPGRATERLTVLAARAAGKTIAPFVFLGNTDKAVFNLWIEKSLLPAMPENGYVVLDNASFHRASDIERLASEAGHEVIWLPSYSPDLNPIERFWAKLKKVHRRICTESGWMDGKSVSVVFDLCPHLTC